MRLIKKWLWFVFGLVLLLALILSSIPAAWVIYGIQQAAPGFRAANATGTLWSGQAELSEWLDRGKVLPLGQLTWALSPWSAILLNPCLQFSARAQDQDIKGNVCYSVLGNKASATELDLRLPMEAMSSFFAVELQGAINAYISKATWQANQLSDTEFTVRWERASIYSGRAWVFLGNVQGEGNDDGNGGLDSEWKSLETSSNQEAVTLNLEVKLRNLHQQKPNMHLSGTIKPSPKNQALLKPMLQFVAEPIGGGTYRIDINE